jgi:hypothetical protein
MSRTLIIRVLQPRYRVIIVQSSNIMYQRFEALPVAMAALTVAPDENGGPLLFGDGRPFPCSQPTGSSCQPPRPPDFATLLQSRSNSMPSPIKFGRCWRSDGWRPSRIPSVVPSARCGITRDETVRNKRIAIASALTKCEAAYVPVQLKYGPPLNEEKG